MNSNSGNSIFKRSLSSLTVFLLLAAGLVAVNVVAGLLPLRLDLTEEGIYTLSEGSRNIASGLTEPVTLKYYFGESLEQVPVAIKSYARKVRELLKEYVSASNGNLILEIYDPKPDTDEEEWATRYGLKGAQLPNGRRLFHGIVALSEGRESTVPFFDPRREKFLEYDISEALTRVKTDKRVTIGVLSSLPVMGRQMAPMAQPNAPWAFIQELSKSYQVEPLTPGDLVEVPEKITLVLVIHPKSLPDTATYALDQYLLRGGRMMVFVDPFSRHESSQRPMMGSRMQNVSSNLDRLMKNWKVKFDSGRIVADLGQPTRVNTPGQGIVDFPVWISVRGDRINRDEVITSQLEEVTMIDSGAIKTEEGFELTFTPLLRSTTNSGTVESIIMSMASPMDIGKNVKTDGEERVLAALISGRFESAFPQGPPPPQKKGDKPAKEPPPRKLPHLTKAEEESSVIFVGDSDFLADRYSVQTINFFGQRVLSPMNDNLNFVLNGAEFMTGSQDLIHIRSRGKFSRPFLKVAELQLAAQMKYKEEEQRLTGTLQEVRKKLKEMEEKKVSGKGVFLGAQQQQTIKKFRLEEQRTSRALREVRKVLRQDIESLGNRLLGINLLAVPILVALFGFFIITGRSKRRGGSS